MRILLLMMLLALISCRPDYSAREQDLLYRLRGSSDLATVEMVFTKVVKGKKSSTILGIETGHSDFLAEIEARAKAGIDLSQIEATDIDWEEGTMTLVLPSPTIIRLEIPSESIRVNEEYTKDHGWFSELSSEDMDRFLRQAELEVKEEVRRMNLEAMTREKTEIFLTRFLSEAGFPTITFTYRHASGES